MVQCLLMDLLRDLHSLRVSTSFWSISSTAWDSLKDVFLQELIDYATHGMDSIDWSSDALCKEEMVMEF